ncbi:Ubiquitin [Corchorus olitorius]|uniref:Ubiquitin n=1 Tax=Corchorus olitorius TaxID=93759 RepID=A0A1R3K471_9ROSI|nr:Ubiquitin [Corchorus olitorius]
MHDDEQLGSSQFVGDMKVRDCQGSVIDFSQTIIMLTSDLGNMRVEPSCMPDEAIMHERKSNKKAKMGVDNLLITLSAKSLQQFVATDVIENALLKLIKDGLVNPSWGPPNSYLFLGLHGHSKAHLANYINENLDTGDGVPLLVDIDLSDFFDDDALLRLKNELRRFVGDEQPALDVGMCRDSLGRLINFSQTIIVLTSDLGNKRKIIVTPHQTRVVRLQMRNDRHLRDHISTLPVMLFFLFKDENDSFYKQATYDWCGDKLRCYVSYMPEHPCSFKIFIEIRQRKKITIAFSSAEAINEVKAKIDDMENIPPQKQFLTFLGKRLMDDKILYDYKIYKESTLEFLEKFPRKATHGQ